MMYDVSFYQGRRVLVTGHTGFKGSWMCRVLIGAGAVLTGYSLPAPIGSNLFGLADIESHMNSTVGDVRDLSHLMQVFDEVQPEIVFHLAAQPIVRTSYEEPVYTYETNVMGTVNLLECIRTHPCVKSFVNITTDKVYENREWAWGYRENEPLDGFDPYSNSKSCSELVTHSYKNSFFTDGHCAISTARAGNVIGGGDFAHDRIIPDCIRAAVNNETIMVRNPHSTRPYQHVLEPILAYLAIAQRQLEDGRYVGSYNVGPDDCDCVATGELVSMFCDTWGKEISWTDYSEKSAPHEASFLKLDCSKIKTTLGLHPRWHIREAVVKTIEWTRVWLEDGNLPVEMDRQIKAYISGQND